MPDNTPNSVQIPAPPQDQLNLPALLSAIGGIGLNIGGITSRAGDVGQGALSLSQHLQAKADEALKSKYREDVANTKVQQSRNLGKMLSPRLGEINNPAARSEIQTAIDNDETDKAQQIFNTEKTQQHLTAREAKDDDQKLNRGLGDIIRQSTDEYQKLKGSLDPNIQKRLDEQTFFVDQKAPFSDAKQLMDAYNGRKGSAKISEKEAQEKFANYQAYLKGKPTDPTHIPLVPDAVNKFFGQTVGWGNPSGTPKDQFSDYAQKTLTPELIQKAQDHATQIQNVVDQANRAHQVRQRLANPKTRQAARDEASNILSGGDQRPPAAPAPASDPAAPQRLYSPSAKKYFLKYPDGRVTPE